jgi:hypothetical protein
VIVEIVTGDGYYPDRRESASLGFWTADGIMHLADGAMFRFDDVLTWYDDERGAEPWIDFGGES